MQLPPQPLGGFQHVAGNADPPISLVPDLLQQPPGRERDIQLAAVEVGVCGPPQQHAAGELSVSSGSAGLLVVGLRGGRRTPVDHQPDRRLVYPHAEGASGDNDVNPISQEIVQSGCTGSLGETGMVRRGPVAGFHECTGYGFRAAPGRSVDDGHGIVSLQKTEQSLQPLLLTGDTYRTEPEIPPVERPEMQCVARPEPERARDFLPHAGRGASGERYRLGLAQPISSARQPAVAGTEIMSPFGNAVRLVHHQQPRPSASGQELFAEALEPLW